MKKGRKVENSGHGDGGTESPLVGFCSESDVTEGKKAPPAGREQGLAGGTALECVSLTLSLSHSWVPWLGLRRESELNLLIQDGRTMEVWS